MKQKSVFLRAHSCLYSYDTDKTFASPSLGILQGGNLQNILCTIPLVLQRRTFQTYQQFFEFDR